LNELIDLVSVDHLSSSQLERRKSEDYGIWTRNLLNSINEKQMARLASC